MTKGEEGENGNPRDGEVSYPYEKENNYGREEIIDAGCNEVFLSRWRFYKKNLLNTTQLAGWMKTGSPKARKHDIRWA